MSVRASGVRDERGEEVPLPQVGRCGEGRRIAPEALVVGGRGRVGERVAVSALGGVTGVAGACSLLGDRLAELAGPHDLPGLEDHPPAHGWVHCAVAGVGLDRFLVHDDRDRAEARLADRGRFGLGRGLVAAEVEREHEQGGQQLSHGGLSPPRAVSQRHS